jgi:two-component system chemotaxis sensor kinase CheA
MTAPADFLAEAGDLVEELSRDLLRLEAGGADPDPALVHGLFRRAHSLKGLAAMFGREAIASLAHGVEDLLDGLRLGRLHPDGALVDVLLEAAELLARLVGEAEGPPPAGGGAGADARALLARIEALAAGATAGDAADPLDDLGLPPAVREVLTGYEAHRLRENRRRGVPIRKVRAAFDLADFDRGLATLTEALQARGEVISTLPSAEPADGIAFDLLVAVGGDLETLAAALAPEHATVAEVGTAAPAPTALAPAPPPAAPPAPLPPPEEPAPVRAASDSVRVDIRRLDGLMAAVGELGLLRSNLQRLADRARSAGLEPAWVAELQRDGRALERRLDELSDGLLAVRMVPLGQAFDRLARLVRRASRETGKELDLAVAGADVELTRGSSRDWRIRSCTWSGTPSTTGSSGRRLAPPPARPAAACSRSGPRSAAATR